MALYLQELLQVFKAQTNVGRFSLFLLVFPLLLLRIVKSGSLGFFSLKFRDSSWFSEMPKR